MKVLKITITSILLFFLFESCNFDKNKKQNILFPVVSETSGLIQPVLLSEDSTFINLEDYFNNCENISKIDFSDRIESINTYENTFKLKCNDSIPPLSIANFWFNDTSYSIILKKSPKVKKKIIYKSEKEVNSVYVAGDFNGWNAVSSPLIYKDNQWEIHLKLFPGRYAYQIIVDGEWILDPSNNETISNNMGGKNSLFAVGNANNDKTPILSLHKTDKNYIYLSYDKKPIKTFVLWDNFEIPENQVIVDDKNNVLKFPIPENASKLERSYIRIYSYNEAGISNDLLIPLSKNQVLKEVNLLNRKDFEASILYFMLVDRFFNGDKLNDEPVNDIEVDFKANYQGGDLKGILDKLKSGYFKEIGINTIWLSPIIQNPKIAYREFPKPNRKYSGYHGYWPISSTQIDYRFGDDKVFKDLVDEAHKQNINVIIDWVANHVHEEHPIIKANPIWATNMKLNDGTPNIRIWDEQRLTTWFDTFLPTLDFSKPEVVDTMTSFAVDWIKKYKLDGFRHDATKHIPEEFWRKLTKKLKNDIIIPNSEKLFQIGETFGNRELIGSYIGPGMLDAQFDFNLYFDARSVFALDNEPFTKLDNSLKESFLFYGNHNLMGNITGNHDIARFISYASEAMTFEEDDKAAGWNREIKVDNPIGYSKLKMLSAFILTIPGIPVIYYGDEIGMPGANDPDNRRMMKFDNLSDNEKSVKDIVKKLSKFRKANLALCYGDFQTLLVNNYQYAFLRKYFDNIVVVVFNKSNKAETIEVELPKIIEVNNTNTLLGNQVNVLNGKLNIKLNQYSFEIITIK